MEPKLSNQQYRFVCEMLWGGVPVDKTWAEETAIFKANAARIIQEYPLLDKSIKTTTDGKQQNS